MRRCVGDECISPDLATVGHYVWGWAVYLEKQLVLVRGRVCEGGGCMWYWQNLAQNANFFRVCIRNRGHGIKFECVFIAHQ